MSLRTIINSLIFIVILALIAFLVFNFITDFRTTLFVVIVLVAAIYAKAHFFKRHVER